MPQGKGNGVFVKAGNKFLSGRCPFCRQWAKMVLKYEENILMLDKHPNCTAQPMIGTKSFNFYVQDLARQEITLDFLPENQEDSSDV